MTRSPATNERTLGLAGRIPLLAILVVGFALAATDAYTFVFYASYAIVGAVLLTRRPRNSIGWLLLVIGLTSIGTTWPGADVSAVAAGAGSLRDTLVVWIGSLSGALSLAGFLALALLFPFGRLPAGRWRRPSIALLGLAVAIVTLSAISPSMTMTTGSTTTVSGPNPFAILPDLAVWDLLQRDALTVGLIILFVAGVVSLVDRYRGSSGIPRLQMRWLVAAVVFLFAGFAVAFGSILVLGEQADAWAWTVAIIASPTVPVAIGVAVLRYRLFEIDRIISRTISWAIVTGSLALVFGAAVVGLQAILSDATQGQTLAVAASTLVAFALFQPLRRRVQAAVDRRFDRARVDAEQITYAFAGRVRDQVDLERLRVELTGIVGATMRPAAAGLWLRRSAPTDAAVTESGRHAATTRP